MAVDAVRAMIARVRDIGASLPDEPTLSNADWLMLPVAKQEVALHRLRALRDYDAIEKPTSVDALRAAKAAGVAIARFYQLVAHWRAHDRSLLSLVPHQSLGAERPTRLAAKETAAAITAAMTGLLASEPTAPTGKVIAHVRRTWKGPGELPSDTALRAFHERAIRNAQATPGTLTLNMGGGPQEGDVVAERFAETLVFDHVSIKGMAAAEDGLPPTITLAIDLWSGAPLGAAAVAGPPGPRGFLLALQDAARRIALARRERGGTGGGAGVLPRLVIATTFASRWGALRDALLAEGYQLVERRDVFLHQGGPTRRLLGMRLDFLPLERRADRREPFRFDPRSTALQPLPTIARLLEEAVDARARRRIPVGAWADAPTFDVAPLVDELGEAMPDEEELPHDQEGPSRRARAPRSGGPVDLGDRLDRLARSRTPGGVRDVRISKSDDQVWHLTVTVDDPGARDAAFLRLAEGAMKLSATHRVPIVVDVETPGDT